MVGDVHLGVAPADAERDLLVFLRAAPAVARSVVIMGDLFDFWFAWRHVMPKVGFRALAAIADLRDAGVEVLWAGGNHDCWGGDELATLTGATYTLDPWTGVIGAWRTTIMHGDGLRPIADRPYRRLRRVLRHPISNRLFGWLHPNHATALATVSSNTSRHRRAADEGRALHDVAGAMMQQPHDPSLVLFGHTHVPTLQRAGNGWYGNAGAWYLDRQFLRITGTQLTRVQWTHSAEGDVLDVVEAPTEKMLAERKEAIRRV